MIHRVVLNTVLAVAVTVWVVDFVAGLVMSSYRSNDSLSAVLLAIIGGTYALQAKRNANGGNRSNGKSGER